MRTDIDAGAIALLPESDSVEAAVLRKLDGIEELIGSVVASWGGSARLLSQRQSQRLPYRKSILVTPLDERTEYPIGKPWTVACRDISFGGISFSHGSPLPHRKVAITFLELSDDAPPIVTRLSWCRFTKEGLYHSGGKFLRTLSQTGIGGARKDEERRTARPA